MRSPSPYLGALVTGFASLGVVGSVLVTRQPEFQQRWALDAADWGWVLFATGLGSVLAYPINRWFFRRLGSRTMMSRFGIAGGAVMALIPWLPDLPGLLLGMFAQGMIYNGVSLAVNHQAAQCEVRENVRMMGRLHATFYVGTMISAFVSSLMAALALALSLHMAAIGLLAAVLHARAARQLPPAPVAAGATSGAAVPAGGWQTLGILAAAHSIVESGIMGWSAIYLNQRLHSGESVAGLGLAVFSGAMAIGRFATDAVATRFGSGRVIVIGALACGVALGVTAASASVSTTMVALAVSGFGLAAVAPILFSAAGRMGGEALALVMSLGAVGGLLGPLLLGQVAKIVSLGTVMSALAAVGLLMAWLARGLREGPACRAAPVGEAIAAAAGEGAEPR